jgi:phenylacetate-CoA ligase
MKYFRNLFYNASLWANDTLLGYSISKQLKFLRGSQYWTKEELEEYQNDKLKLLVTEAYKNVPFYTDLFEKYKLTPSDIQSSADLEKLPVLTKSDLRNAFKNGSLINKTLKKKDLIFNSSSGSTGEPFQFYQDKQTYSMVRASALRAFEWMGFEPGMKILRINYMPRSRTIKRIQDYASNNLYFRFSDLNHDELDMVCKLIIKEKPDIIRCYPEPLAVIAKHYSRYYNAKQAIKICSTTGSNLSYATRETIENIFQCEVFDGFSCEGGSSVAECPEHSYHSAMEYAITEVMPHDRDETLGNLITTDLWNYACPFIRYDTEDVVRVNNDKCNCGRELLRISEIRGRSSDVIETISKGKVWTTTLVGVIQNYSQIEQFQLVQNKNKKLKLRLRVNKEYSDAIGEDLVGRLNKIVGAESKLFLEIVESFIISHNGKVKMLVEEEF